MLLSSRASRRTSRNRPRCRLQVEPLEDRWLLAGGLSATLVADVVAGTNSSSPQDLTNVNGTLYFRTADINSPGLWKSDGTAAGTVLLQNGTVDNLTNVNGTLWFSRTGGALGWELWKSDGTTAGSVLVKSVAANDLTPLNGRLFFAGDDGNGKGSELWVSDGTSGGTKLVKDIYTGSGQTEVCDERGVHCHWVKTPNSSEPRWLTNLTGTHLFTADDGITGWELWKSDGSAKGTT